ncbi:hypothetical protein [Magnetovibrio sp.]|uniref:hypothetical protein n=1 Tax=Magnetovibrio sp. TaxID=2024836 RepID=UPI002F958A54
MTEHLFNVKRVARIICRIDDDKALEQTVRKIRHWTNSDILSTVGEKNTGTGVSRMYDENAVYIAALMLEITRYGITVDMLETFEEWISECWEETDDWEEAKSGQREVIFQLGWQDNGSGFFCPVRDDKELFWKPNGGAEREAYTSSIVVNVTNVFKRLNW